MQISSVSNVYAHFLSSAAVKGSAGQGGQFLPAPAPSAGGAVFGLPAARRAASAAAAQEPSSPAENRLFSSQVAAAYQSAMNAQGVYGLQSTLGVAPMLA